MGSYSSEVRFNITPPDRQSQPIKMLAEDECILVLVLDDNYQLGPGDQL